MTPASNLPAELTEEARRTLGFFHAGQLTFALAESCTGGLCAAAFTGIPGASSRFLCGYVVYSNEAKRRDLGVSEETLARFGAVSSETVSVQYQRFNPHIYKKMAAYSAYQNAHKLKMRG